MQKRVIRGSLQVLAFLFCLFAAGTFAYARNEAPTPELRIPSPPNRILETGGFAISGLEDPDAWQFIMGPQGPNAVMSLMRRIAHNAVMFRCSRSTGEVEMGVVMRDLVLPEAENRPLAIQVVREKHTINARILPPIPDGRETPMRVSGMAVIDILAAMARADGYPEIIAFEAEGRRMEFPIGGWSSSFSIAAQICLSWQSDKKN